MKRPGLLFAFCLTLAATGGLAQDDSGGSSGGAADGNDLDSRYVLPEFDFAVLLHPQRAWQSKPAKLVGQRDAWADFLRDESGLDPRTMTRILMLNELPKQEMAGRPPRWKVPAIVVWASEPIDAKTFVRESPLKEDEPLEHRGVRYWTSRGATEPAVAFPDPKTMLFARPEVLLSLIDAHQSKAKPVESELSRRLAGTNLDADLVFAAEFDAKERKLMQDILASANQQFPPNVKVLLDALVRSESGVVHVDLSDEALIRARLGVDDEDAAKQLETQSREGIKGLSQLVDTLVTFSDDAALKERLGLVGGILRGAKVDREGTTVGLTMPPPADWSPLTTGLDEEIAKMLAREQRLRERRNDFGGDKPAN